MIQEHPPSLAALARGFASSLGDEQAAHARVLQNHVVLPAQHANAE